MQMLRIATIKKRLLALNIWQMYEYEELTEVKSMVMMDLIC